MATSFILASASPRRLQLLTQIGLTPAEIIHPNIDEAPLKAEQPDKYALRCAEAKALAVAAKHPDAIILAADTVVAAGRRILPKAENEKTARKCLELLSGRRHRVYTAVCLCIPSPVGGGLGWGHNFSALQECPPPNLPPMGGGIRTRLVITQLRFSRLSVKDIDAYIASDEWQGKAGGYAIQGKAEAFIPWISGSYSNVVGLPLAETAAMLAQYKITGM